MSLDLSKPVTTNQFVRELYKKFFGITNAYPAGTDRTGVCGGTASVIPSANAFAQPSYIECAGADGTITGVDEYGNVVTAYPMTVGKITASRWSKVTAASAGVVLWRHYSI